MSDELTPETVNDAPLPVAEPKPARKPRTIVKPVEPVEDDGLVWVTITKAGDDVVHDGKGGRLGRGERIRVSLETAVSLEARHFAETD